MQADHSTINAAGASPQPDFSFLGMPAPSASPAEGDFDQRVDHALDLFGLNSDLDEEIAAARRACRCATEPSEYVPQWTLYIDEDVTAGDLAEHYSLAELNELADKAEASIAAARAAREAVRVREAEITEAWKRDQEEQWLGGEIFNAACEAGVAIDAYERFKARVLSSPPPTEGTRQWLAAEARREAASEALARSSSEAALSGFAELIPGNFDKTEDAFALSIERSYAPRLRYVHGVGKWRIWNGVRWVDDQSGAVRDLIRRSVRAGNTEGAAAQGRAAFVTGVENLMRCSRACATTAEEWDRDLMLLGTPSGTLDLTTGILHAAKPESLISKAAGVDPADTGAVPRRWLAFLHDCTGGDEELIAYLQRVLGYALTGLTVEHKLVFIYGEGGNGKGVFLDTVRGIFGAYGQAADIKLFTAQKYEGHPTDRAALIGARLVTASETERGHAWAESRLKSLTGGDPIRARFMRQDEIQFDPQFQLLIVGNHKPSLSTIDDAIRRRLVLVEFNRKPAVVNPHLAAELRAEWPAILRWMIDGCLAWQRDGLGDAPAAVVAATEAYFDEQDTLGGWLAENCEIGGTFKESGSTLFRDWSEYCRAVGADAGSLTSFGTSLDRRGFAAKKSHGINKRQGLRLRQFGAGQSLGSDGEGLL